MKFFTRKIKTYNGEKVYEGDMLCFINSDGEHCQQPLKYCKETKKLFFWNNRFPVKAYRNLKKCTCKTIS